MMHDGMAMSFVLNMAMALVGEEQVQHTRLSRFLLLVPVHSAFIDALYNMDAYLRFEKRIIIETLTNHQTF